jgi:hypothetical protein
MTDYLKGNYKLDAKIAEPTEAAGDTTDEFEKKALARLGGSICFVSKKGFLWTGDGDGNDGSGTADRGPAR